MTRPVWEVLQVDEFPNQQGCDGVSHLLVEHLSGSRGVAVGAPAETGLGTATPLCRVGERVGAVLALAVLVLVVELIEHNEGVLLFGDAVSHDVS